MEYDYYIEVDTMEGMETYFFKSNKKDLYDYLEEKMFWGNIKKAIFLQDKNIELVGYWDFNDNYYTLDEIKEELENESNVV